MGRGRAVPAESLIRTLHPSCFEVSCEHNGKFTLTPQPAVCTLSRLVFTGTWSHKGALIFMTQLRCLSLVFATVIGVPATTCVIYAEEPSRVLWQIGQKDKDNSELALSPADYSKFHTDAFFVIGQSVPKQDWPYVQPGPTDNWAGSRPHTFIILFGVAAQSSNGTCRLTLDLLDTQSTVPPPLEICVNGSVFERRMPPGAGDASIFGQPDKGKHHTCVVEFPASLLAGGNNRIAVTTTGGAWILYDAVTLEVPRGIDSAPVEGLLEMQQAEAIPAQANRNGVNSLRIVASVLRAGPPVRAAFTLDGQPVDTVEVKAGIQSVELFVPAVDRVRNATLAMAVDGQERGRKGITLTPGVREVIVVSKTHFDIGYTDLASKVVERYRTTMADQALKLVEESRNLPPDRQFSWTLAGWPMAQILFPGQTAERRERFLAAMRQGRLVPQAMAFTTHTESLDLEDLTRGLQYSVQMAKLAGQPLPTAAKMTDVTAHASATATVLARGGVKFFHLGSNEGCSHPDVPPVYWWEGPDGSRVLTVLSAAYGTDLRPPRDWPYKTWLCMWMTGDNHGPPNGEEVERLFSRAEKELPGVRVRFGQMSDFADAILRENPELPVVRADMPDTWIHGIDSMPVETQLAHTVRPRIAALESLDTLLGAWGVRPPRAGDAVREAYENTLLFGEHTWGPDVPRYAGFNYGEQWRKRLAAGEYRFLLEGFDQKRAYAHRAAQLVEPAIAESAASLAQAVNVQGRRIVVFNPLPWQRDDAIDVAWTGTADGVRDAGSQEILPAAVRDGRLQFVAKSLPSLGYKTFTVVSSPESAAEREVDSNNSKAKQQTAAANPQSQQIENEYFRVILDPGRCGLRSIVDKRTGRELINTDSPYALGQYLYERFDADQNAEFTHAYVKSPTSGEMVSHGKPNLPPAKEQPRRSAAAADATLEIRQSATSVTAVMSAKPRGIIPDGTTLRVTLNAGTPWLDLEWSIANKTPDPWPEAGWLCFPVRADDPSFHLARLGCVVDPAKDLVPGSNHEVFCLNGGLLVTGSDGNSTGICPIDAQLVSLEHRGLWRYSRDFVAHKPDVFVMLFNNLYSTNFAQWIDGTWSSRVRLWVPGKGESKKESLIGASWEARTACLAAVSDAPSGKLPPSSAGLVISKKSDSSSPQRGPLVTAFGANPYGKGTLLRLWEQTGDSGKYRIQLPAGMKASRAQPCDLRGQPLGDPLVVSDQGTFEVTIEPLAPLSVVLTD